MRILIDECVDERLRHLFPDHDCRMARFSGLAGLKNGRLLDAAEAAGFNVLLTVDQNIPDQQKSVRSKHFIDDPLWTHEPLERSGADCTRRHYRSGPDCLRCCCTGS